MKYPASRVIASAGALWKGSRPHDIVSPRGLTMILEPLNILVDHQG